MAKMFYTLEEASARLGLDIEAVKEMAASGKLQQFRDRDKLMFKREQVDSMASVGESTDGSSLGIPLADPGPDDTDAISLADSMAGGGEPDDPREGTGISVFDAGEVEPADPMAQTQVTQPQIDDEELALESVGSGSGLLDLTRESDDTSLGAELHDEIYPGGGDTGTGASSADFGLESSVGSSGVFEGALAMDTGTSGPSGLENLVETDPGSMDLPGAGVTASAAPVSYAAAEESDPAGSALGAGLLIGATVALFIGLIVIAAALAGSRSALTSMLVVDGSASKVMFLCVGLAVLSAVLGGVGFVIGKKSA
ncbi:MAG: helix-turn-helix domain-containing protein [Planctomycetota bacterium]